MWNKFKHSIASFFAVYCREFRLVLHDQGIILFFAFLPLAYPIIYSLIYNPELVREVKMVVVDHDRSQISRELVRKLDACQEVYVRGYAADMNEAKRAMHSHECFGILEIPEGFGRKTGSGEQANAVLYSDMSLLLRYRGFLVASTNVMQEMSAELQLEKINQVAPLAATISSGDLMSVNNISMGNISNGFDSFIMPGVVILILQQCIILAVGMAGGAKRANPRLIGYVGVNQGESVLGSMLAQMLCYFTIIMLPAIFLVHYVPLIFSFPMAGDFWEILAFIMPMILGSICVGFCVQSVCSERESVFVLWVITSVVFLFLSGLTWPRYAMHGFWRFLSDCVPATWGVGGFIKMNANGSSLAQVRPEYINLWIQTGVYFVLAYVVQRWIVYPQLWRTPENTVTAKD